MNKTTKLIIAFVMATISALLIPIFTQWYYQQTGIYPIGFWFVWILGGIFSIIGIATNNFKDF
jgi:hypothetical protein